MLSMIPPIRMSELETKDWLGIIFLLPLYIIISAPIILTINILNLPIFPKTKREPVGPNIVCIIYAPVTFSERAIDKLREFLV